MKESSSLSVSYLSPDQLNHGLYLSNIYLGFFSCQIEKYGSSTKRHEVYYHN